MNALDIGLVILACALVLWGLLKGFVRILVAIVALVLAFVLASRFHGAVAAMGPGARIPAGAAGLIAYALIFLGVLVAGAVAGWLLGKLVRAALLGWADRLAGAALGFVAAVLAGSLVLLPLAAYLPRGAALLEGSALAPYVAAVADLVNLASPDDLAARYREGIVRVRRLWRGEAELTPRPDAAGGGKAAKPGPDASR